MGKLNHDWVKASLEMADNERSKLSERERELHGLSSTRLRCLINNLCFMLWSMPPCLCSIYSSCSLNSSGHALDLGTVETVYTYQADVLLRMLTFFLPSMLLTQFMALNIDAVHALDPAHAILTFHAFDAVHFLDAVHFS